MADSSRSQGHPATIAAQGLGWVEAQTRAISPPIHVSSTFERAADNSYPAGRNYVRPDNPSFDQPEAVLKALEGGSDAMLFSSGMAAATAVFQALSPGDHVIAPRVMYWSLRHWLVNFARRWGLKVQIVDMTKLDEIAAAIRPGETRLIWVETPANPTWAITDIAAVAQLCRKAGAVLAVDSTAATPVLTRPLELGADLVMHSATKYLNGHSDIVAGALVARQNGEFWERLKLIRTQIGGVLGSFEAWLLLRGIRTLFPRVKLASSNAMAIAQALEGEAHLEQVLYPGLESFPDHAIATRQMAGGYGGMLSIRVRGGEQAAIRAAGNLKIWKRATSLGGVESLVEHRASVEGPDSPCPPDLLRLSTGIEDVRDLIDDFRQALGN